MRGNKLVFGLAGAFAILFLASALSPLSGNTAAVNTAAVSQPEYRLKLFHTHTNEHIDVLYREGDHYIPSAIAQLDHFLRDHRTGEVHEFDPRLFDLLHDLPAAAGQKNGEINIICGYRTPWSNEFLRKTGGGGVAAHSLHMEGEAIDIRIPGITTTSLRDAALGLHRGGVGYYPTSQFVHVDVGRVRTWQFPVPVVSAAIAKP